MYLHIYNLIEKNQIEELGKLQISPAEIRKCEKGRASFLYRACYLRNSEAIKIIIGWGVNVDRAYNSKFAPTPLFLACERGYIEIVALLLQSGANPNLNVGTPKRTPFHVACEIGNIQMMETFLKFNVDLSVNNQYGRSPLSLAASGKNLAKVKKLIDLGINQIDTDNFGNIPFHYACKNGAYEIAVLMLTHSENKNDLINKIGNDGDSSLHFAIRGGNIDIIELLISLGADLDCKNKSNYFPIELAVSLRSFDIVEVLIKVKGEIDKLENFYFEQLKNFPQEVKFQLESILLIHKSNFKIHSKSAIKHVKNFISIKNEEALKIMHEKGYLTDKNIPMYLEYASIEENQAISEFLMRKSYTFHYQHPYIKNIDKNGGFPCTKLIDAVKKDELDNVQTLLALGVDPNFVTNDNGWLIETVDSVEMAKLLVNYGVKINHEVGFEIPYFIGICQQEKLDLLRYLISIGMDVTVKNLNGENVLCFFGIENTEILKTLIDAGIDLDAGEAGIADGAIHVFNTNIDCLELLIENNIDIHKLGYNERSALYGSDYKVANLLISLGLEVNVQDEDGDSPLRHAFDIHSAEVLILNGADLDSDDLKKGAPYDNWVEEYSKIMALVEYYTPLVGHLRNNKTTKLHCVQSVKVAELLLIDNSIEINALNLYNQTPLMAAISRGNYDIAMLLIEKGGKIYTGTSNRYSPIYLYPDQKFTNFYLEQSSRFFTKNSIEGLPKLANKIINQIQMGENIEVSSEAEEYVLTVNRNDWKLPLYFNLRNSESAVLNMNFQSIADCDANTKNKIVKEVKDEFKRRVKKNGSLDGNHGQILIDSNFSISYQAEFVKMNLLINHQSFESFIKYAIDTILDFIEIIQNSKQSISRPIIPTTVQTKEVSIYQKVDNMLKQYTYEYWSSSDSFGIKIPIKAKSYLKVDVLIYSDNHIGFTSSPYLLKRIDEYDFKRIKKWLVEKGVMFKNQYGIDLELDGLTVSQKLYYYFSELNENSFLNSLAQFIECSLYVNNYLYRYMKSYYEVESETGGGFNNWFWHNK